MLNLKISFHWLKETIFGKRVNGIKPTSTYRTVGTHLLSEQDWYRAYNVSMLYGRNVTYIG